MSLLSWRGRKGKRLRRRKWNADWKGLRDEQRDPECSGWIGGVTTGLPGVGWEDVCCWSHQEKLDKRSAPVCCLLQKTGAPLLPCLCCCALHRPQDEDLHQWTQSTNQAALLLPVQAKVGAGPKVCRGAGACGVSLQKRFNIVLSRCIPCNAM